MSGIHRSRSIRLKNQVHVENARAARDGYASQPLLAEAEPQRLKSHGIGLLAVDFQKDIAVLESCHRRGAVGIDELGDHPLRLSQSERRRGWQPPDALIRATAARWTRALHRPFGSGVTGWFDSEKQRTRP